MIDTFTLIIILIVIILICVAFFLAFLSIRWLLMTVFIKPVDRFFRLVTENANNSDQDTHYAVQTLSDADEIQMVPLRPDELEVFPQRFTRRGQGIVVNADAVCLLTGKRLVECVNDRNCNCEEREEILQRLYGRKDFD